MKVSFYIDDSNGMSLPKAKSDQIVDGCDLIDLLLSGDLSRVEEVRKFVKTVFEENDTWWFNASKVTPNGSTAVVQAAFDVSAEMKINIESLKKLIQQWEKFLGNHKKTSFNIA